MWIFAERCGWMRSTLQKHKEKQVLIVLLLNYISLHGRRFRFQYIIIKRFRESFFIVENWSCCARCQTAKRTTSNPVTNALINRNVKLLSFVKIRVWLRVSQKQCNRKKSLMIWNKIVGSPPECHNNVEHDALLLSTCRVTIDLQNFSLWYV